MVEKNSESPTVATTNFVIYIFAFIKTFFITEVIILFPTK